MGEGEGEGDGEKVGVRIHVRSQTSAMMVGTAERARARLGGMRQAQRTRPTDNSAKLAGVADGTVCKLPLA